MTKAEKAARYWGKLADAYEESQLLAGSTYPPIIEKLKGEFICPMIGFWRWEQVQAY